MTDDARDDDETAEADADETEPSEEIVDQQVGPMAGGGIPTAVKRVQGVWDEVLADVEATAEEYRADGWEVLELHPGDVAAATGREGGRWGLDVVIGGNEWAEVERLIEEEGRSFDSVEVFRADAGGVLVLLVVLRDEEAKSAILYPAYYDVQEGQPMVEKAVAEGAMQTHLRPLDTRRIYTFVHEDLELFLPGDGA